MHLKVTLSRGYYPYHNRVYNISVSYQECIFYISLYQKDRDYYYKIKNPSNYARWFKSKKELFLYIIDKMLIIKYTDKN